MYCIILLKTLILFALFGLLNSDNSIKSFITEENIIYDEIQNTVTEDYKPHRSTSDITDTTTAVEEMVIDENNLNVVCPYFKNVGEINLEHFQGVWRPTYYQVSQKVPCFKMIIRKVTSQEKNNYSQLYGDFNDNVFWDDCNIEIKSSAGLAYRKHFLQGREKGFGVLENIIIEQKGNAVPSLIEENADQWHTIKNLLLMRDCISGEIVIFSKEAYNPKLNEVLVAMKKFGNISNGVWACNDGSGTGRPVDGEFEPDNDLVLFN